jgi:hypothetical protein
VTDKSVYEVNDISTMCEAFILMAEDINQILNTQNGLEHRHDTELNRYALQQEHTVIPAPCKPVLRNWTMMYVAPSISD